MSQALTQAGAIKQFVVACSGTNAAVAASAMQYLPTNFLLMVDSSNPREQLGVLADDRAIMDRVITSRMETPKTASPSSFERVMLNGDTTLQTPEAYASAMLVASRAAA